MSLGRLPRVASSPVGSALFDECLDAFASPGRTRRFLPGLLLELETFFETGWVGWDVKTAVEFACGTIRGKNIQDPVACVARARSITYDHECREQGVYRTYTWLAWAALVPLLAAVVVGAFVVAGAAAARRKRPGA